MFFVFVLRIWIVLCLERIIFLRPIIHLVGITGGCAQRGRKPQKWRNEKNKTGTSQITKKDCVMSKQNNARRKKKKGNQVEKLKTTCFSPPFYETEKCLQQI